MKLKIINGFIVDGTGEKGFNGELLIEDERIIKIDEKIDSNADEVIDAKGHVVTPGFIDTHSHSGLKIFSNPFMEEKIFQGITTEIIGQDGISVVPLSEKDIEVWKENVYEIEGGDPSYDWNCKNVSNYLRNIQKCGTSINFGYLVPHGNIRMKVLGFSDKAATKKQLIEMQENLIKELKGGAIGMSSGLIYTPCSFGNKEELIELCKIVAEENGVFAVHQRSEANEIITSIKEIIDIARQSGVRLHISHFKICGKRNWNKITEIFKLLDDAKKDGIKVSYDQYPYTAGCTTLGVTLPPWVHEGGTNRLIARLKDKEIRKKIKEEILQTDCLWDNFIEFAGLEGIYITKTKNTKYLGKNLLEIGAIERKDPLDAMMDLIIDENNNVGMIDYYGNEETLIKLMQREEQNFCTDGVLGESPHPRAYGSYPRVLGRYCREDGILSLEESIFKMTKKPAEVFSIRDRGVLKEGYYADIVIFDKDRIIDNATYIMPCEYSIGIDMVLINGIVVVENNRHMKKSTGRIIKKLS